MGALEPLQQSRTSPNGAAGLSPDPPRRVEPTQWSPQPPARGQEAPAVPALRCPEPSGASHPQGSCPPSTCPGQGAEWGVTIRAPPPAPPQQSVLPDARMHLLEHGPLSHPRLAGAPSPPALAPMKHETQAERSETVGGRKQGHGCPETSPPGGEEAPYLGTCSGLRLDRTPPPEAATQAKLWIPAAQGGPALAGPAGGGWRAWE